MRKLSKKISMLMVLAMLVSLFSGIVSASAASAWSFVSSKYDVDFKETITMDKNEYADFDLYKEGKEVTKATYTVKWESSDEDVVWVNAKTGQLRADKFGVAEAGDKAKISATFTNVATKKSATRYFYIEIADDAKYEIAVNFGDEAFVVGQKYDLAATVKADGKEVEAKVEFSIDGKAIDAAYTPAAAGEVTIVAVAKIDGKKVAKAETKVVVAEDSIVAVKQTTMNSVAITCATEATAKAIAADSSKLASVYFFVTNVNEIQAFVKSVEVDKNDATVVNVTLYNDITKDTTYKFTYNGKSLTIVGVDRDKISSMSIKTVEGAKGESTVVKVNLYNADGILVQTDVTTGFSLEALTSGDYSISGNNIYFHDTGKTAQVKATYWMGYDENGNKIPDLVAVGAITSFDRAARSMSKITAWTTDGTNFSANNSVSAEIGENGQVGFRFTKTDHFGGNANVNYFGGDLSQDNWLATYGYAIGFESSNPNVVLVDETSTLGYYYPLGAGTAQIIVNRYPTARPWEKEVIGVFNVTVVQRRTLTTLAPTLSGTKLSSATDASIKLMPNAKDQTGAYICADPEVQIYVKLATTAPAGITLTANGATVPYVQYGDGIQVTTAKDWAGDTPYITLKATNNVDWQERLIHVIVTAKQTNGPTLSSQVVAIRTKAPQAAASYAFDSVNGSFDLNLPADQWNDNYNRFKTVVKLSAYDTAGYLVDVYDTDLHTSRAAAVASGDSFFYTFEKDYSPVTLADNTFYALSVSGSALVKNQTGTYTLKAYKVVANNQNQYLATKNIVVSDSTKALTAVKLDNKLYGVTDPSQVMANLVLNTKIGFMRNGERVWGNNISIVDVDSVVYVNANRVNVQTVTVRENYGGGKYFDYVVPVYMTYETN